MRIFQSAGLYPRYIERLDRMVGRDTVFSDRRAAFLNDGYGALHILKPVLTSEASAFFTNANDEKLQRAWADENGLSQSYSMQDILLAQIEAHKTEIFYNLDPMSHGNALLKRLPSCVKLNVTWRAAPSLGGEFQNYDIMLNNFPAILDGYRAQGMRAEYFCPGHDPKMDSYARNENRPIDVLFVGGYSRHHRKRAEILEAVAKLRDRYNIVFYLDRSRMTRLAETPAGWIGPLAKHRRPKDIRDVSMEAVFGLDLYTAISKTKIVINGAVDMAGDDRGNMRCWEAMGCGAMLLSDAGNYPDGMVDGETMASYSGGNDAAQKIMHYLNNTDERKEVAQKGHQLVRHAYSKDAQLKLFQQIVSR
jgi:hypothetical protein